MNRYLRRLAQVLVSVGIVAGLGMATAGAASAHPTGEPACNYVDGVYNACLRIDYIGNGYFRVSVGIDITMSQQQAQYEINRGSVFNVTVISNENELLLTPYQQSVVAWPGGLSGGWSQDVPRSWLDEDSGQDEVLGRIMFQGTARNSQTRLTGQVEGNF